MHWGHTVSKDLIHWSNKEIALSPFSLGTIYSGCALTDKKNVTGLKKVGIFFLLGPVKNKTNSFFGF